MTEPSLQSGVAFDAVEKGSGHTLERFISQLAQQIDRNGDAMLEPQRRTIAAAYASFSMRCNYLGTGLEGLSHEGRCKFSEIVRAMPKGIEYCVEALVEQLNALADRRPLRSPFSQFDTKDAPLFMINDLKMYLGWDADSQMFGTPEQKTGCRINDAAKAEVLKVAQRFDKKYSRQVAHEANGIVLMIREGAS